MNFGIPWNEIKARWESGESAYFIEQDLNRKGQKITRQGINARAKRDGWIEKANGGLLAVAEQLPTVQAIGKGIDSTKRTPEIIAAVLEDISQGVPEYLAATSQGLGERTLARWKADDEALAYQIKCARAKHLGSRVAVLTKAGDRGDWKAAQVQLKAAPETKDYFAEDTKPTAIQFVLNIIREPTGTIIEGEKA